MLKFVLGVVAGAVLSVAYVWFNATLPPFLQLPMQLRGNLVSSAVEEQLYTFDADAPARLRALEVYLGNRARDAAMLDAEAGHPLLHAMHRKRAIREARLLLARRSAHDEALARPALREALVHRHGPGDDATLNDAMLAEAFADAVFLKAWMESNSYATAPRTLTASLQTVAALRLDAL